MPQFAWKRRLNRLVRQARGRAKALLDPQSRTAFVRSLPPGSHVLDVGCGNHSAQRFREMNPTLRYTGIDIGAYNMDEEDYRVAAEIVVVPPEQFAGRIRQFGAVFDAVVSAHNLEHTDAPQLVLEAMCACLKTGGRLYLSFPCAESAHFPVRNGPLNFYTDPTHRHLLDFEGTCATLERLGCTVLLRTKRRHAPLLSLAGAVLEPLSVALNRVLPAVTWAYWGFESIIIAQKRAAA